MPVQALFLEQVYAVRSLRYVWSEDGTLLLALDCHDRESNGVMLFEDLRSQLMALCPWQMSGQVTIGMQHALAEVLTMYHAFEWARVDHQTLMLVSTPPDEYFEAAA